MAESSAELLERLRELFDTAPYPRMPLEDSPKGDIKSLYFHDLSVAYYARNQQLVTNFADKVILDAGCGSGYKALALAEANPGAKIVGVDLSEASVKLARERLKYHGFDNVEFHALSIEELPSLGLEFDYINCDEVLYLLPDPVAGLTAMKAVLKLDGIIRANLHHRLQRSWFYQGQEFFSHLGVMDQSPDEGVVAVRELMRALRDDVVLKNRTWQPTYETDKDFLLANYLLRGDKGFSIPDLFSMLQQADLEFINMINWWHWDLVNLFEDFSELPVEIALTLAEKSLEEQLQLFALIHPVHRLLDFWCGHPGQARPYVAVENWTDAQWHQATVHLYAQFKIPAIKQEMVSAITAAGWFDISRYFVRDPELINLDSLFTACLLLLFDAPQSVEAIVQHWKKLRPLNLITLQPTTDAEAFEVIKSQLAQLEKQGHIFLELPE